MFDNKTGGCVSECDEVGWMCVRELVLLLCVRLELVVSCGRWLWKRMVKSKAGWGCWLCCIARHNNN